MPNIEKMGFRYILLLSVLLFVVSIYSNRISFGFTVICQEEEVAALNETTHYLADKVNKAWMFSATAIGMCVGPIPLHWLYKYNTRSMIVFYGLLSAFASIIYPLFDSYGLWPALFCRFLAGFCQATQLHFANEFVLRWAAKAEQSLFFSIILSGSQFGPLITMIIGGETCSTSWLGWRATYYILGAITAASSLAYGYMYHDNPEDSPYCSKKERALITADKAISAKKPPVPYKALLSDLEIWGSLIMFCGYYVGMIVYQQYSPTFIRQVLNFSIRETGYFASIPMVFAIVIKVVVGKLIDYGFGLKPKWALGVPLIVLESFSAFAMFMTGFAEDRKVALAFDMLFAIFHFFVPVICSRTIQIVAGEHSHFALNFNMFIAGLIQIVLPGAVHLLANENSRSQWSLIFYIIAGLIVFTTVLYLFVTNAELADWAQPTAETPQTEISKDSSQEFHDIADDVEKISSISSSIENVKKC